MKFFLKLCTVSVIYGLLYYWFMYLTTSPYELEKNTGWSQNSISTILSIYISVLLILGIIIIPIITNKWLQGSMHSLWTSILWVPFVFIWGILFGILFPSLYPELDLLSETLEEENITNVLLTGFSLLIYPLFIIGVTALSILLSLKKKMQL